MTQASANCLQQWLKGWKLRANPFERCHAESEADLESYFITTPAYEEALQGGTSLIFIDTGCGKTAHRMMLARDAYPQSLQSDILGVEYTEFASLLPELHREAIQVSARQHIEKILQLATHNLLLSIIKRPEIAAGLPGEWLARLAWFCETYRPLLFTPFEVIKQMRESVQDESVLEWPAFRQAWDDRLMSAYLEQLKINAPVCVFLARLRDSKPDSPMMRQASDLLELFAATLLPEVGIERLQILVEGLENVARFRTNTPDLLEFIYPMISDFRLMKLRGVSFIFLLPMTLQDYLAKHEDKELLTRLVCREVRWDQAGLSSLIKERLESYRREEGDCALASLCAPGLQQKIEALLFGVSKGSPREALEWCNALLEAHCNRKKDSQFFDYEDWWAVITTRYGVSPASYENGNALIHPPLRITVETEQVFVGGDEKKLTGSAYELLLIFYQHPNKWMSWREINELIDIELTYDHFRKSISRIRKIIEPDPKKPVYLVTKRGVGIKLNVWPEIS